MKTLPVIGVTWEDTDPPIGTATPDWSTMESSTVKVSETASGCQYNYWKIHRNMIEDDESQQTSGRNSDHWDNRLNKPRWNLLGDRRCNWNCDSWWMYNRVLHNDRIRNWWFENIPFRWSGEIYIKRLFTHAWINRRSDGCDKSRRNLLWDRRGDWDNHSSVIDHRILYSRCVRNC